MPTLHKNSSSHLSSFEWCNGVYEGEIVSVVSSRYVLIKMLDMGFEFAIKKSHPSPGGRSQACAWSSSKDPRVCVTFEISKEPSNLGPVSILLSHRLEGKQTTSRLLLIMTLRKPQSPEYVGMWIVTKMIRLSFLVNRFVMLKKSQKGDGKKYISSENQFRHVVLDVLVPLDTQKAIFFFIYIRPYDLARRRHMVFSPIQGVEKL